MVKNTAVKGKPTLEELKKAPREKHIPGYNFCGPSTQLALRKSGQYEQMMKQAGRKPIGTKPYGKPVNRLDTACKAHDNVFSKKKATGEQVRAADNRLIKAAFSISKGGTGIGKKERAAAAAVVAGIGGKVALEKAGVVRKGAFAAGGEKEAKLKRGVKKGVKRVFKAIGRIGVRKPSKIMRGFANRQLGAAGGAAPPVPNK